MKYDSLSVTLYSGDALILNNLVCSRFWVSSWFLVKILNTICSTLNVVMVVAYSLLHQIFGAFVRHSHKQDWKVRLVLIQFIIHWTTLLWDVSSESKGWVRISMILFIAMLMAQAAFCKQKTLQKGLRISFFVCLSFFPWPSPRVWSRI